jgi:glycosyltransferase involved in cell wall biosynthesis
MVKLYALQAKRLENLQLYDAIVTHSEHMLAELIKHGLSPQRAYNFPYYVHSTKTNGGSSREVRPPGATDSIRSLPSADEEPGLEKRTTQHWHLFFCGRMERLKGGRVFLEALPAVSAALDRPLRVTFAGDGRERQAWEARAGQLLNPKIMIDFVGWADRCEIEALLESCDLLVVPSLWPEPFGLVGPEAGLAGVPVAAFAVGGIPDWLVDGVNGYLASGDPPTSEGLAHAIISCLEDPVTHARLRRGAREVAQQFNIKNHLMALTEVFSNVVSD